MPILQSMGSKMKSAESGFTMIELLVVVTIIGILAATSLQSYDTIREKVWTAEQQSMFNNLRTAFEARSGDTSSLAVNAYRRVYNNYRTTAWTENNTTADELIPGLPLPVPMKSGAHSQGSDKSRYYVYALERNCSPTSGSCVKIDLRVYNCNDGMIQRFFQRQNGSSSNYTYYNSTHDSRC